MKNSLFLFFIVLNLSILGQTFPTDSCDQGTYTMNTIFYSNTTSVLDSTQSTDGIYLCGPNTIVYDTLKFPGCRFVYINPGCTYITNSPSCSIFDMYFIKDNGTIIIRPDANYSEFNIYHEPLATISPSTAGCLSVTLCSALVFPPINCSVGIAESTVQEAIFKTYPNPNNGNMVLAYTINATDKAEISIYDISGKLINNYSLNSSENMVRISEDELNNGVYFYELIVNKKIVQSDKLIIIK